ncbi:MAG TPA: hypothetical protein VNV82_08925 [Bryobacteraceae bacterium]|jgi:hypothetical protein|nr:hypothetical protein [Bryobacteraceae bacterium]
MARIRSLRANVSREEAMQQFSSGMLDFLRETALGPLRSVADFYIPFRLFQVEILNGGKRDLRVFGLDAVNGSLDLYHFEQLPGEREVTYLETRNCSEALLGEAEANKVVIAKVQRLLFSTGFFRVRHLQITAEPVAGEIYVPYWVGFRGRGNRARLAVIDALRRKPEGAKVRQLLRAWLTSIRAA